MEDKDLMENHLLVVKGICDLYMHGCLESTTAEVHATFKNALNKELDIQNKIYNLMAARNWYTTSQADQTKIENAKQKFSNC